MPERAHFCALLVFIAAQLLMQVGAAAQSAPTFARPDAQKRANQVLAVLSFTVTPELSASTLGIHNGSSGNPSLNMTESGGGFTLSQRFPLNLEGALAVRATPRRFWCRTARSRARCRPDERTSRRPVPSDRTFR